MKIILRLILLLPVFTANAQDNYLLIGTYTSGNSEGIYVYDFNSSSGNFAYRSKIKSPNPSFLAVSPGQQYVYAVYEEGVNKGGGSVAAYSFNKKSGELSFINQQLSGGDHPCYVAVDKTGNWVTAANYTGGSLSVLPVNADGQLGEARQVVQHTGSSTNKERQEKAHVHGTFFSADNRFLFAPDLGTDKLTIYAFNDKTGKLTEAAQPFVQSPDNGGPRHMAFTPNNKYAYLMEELTGTVVGYVYNSGKLTQMQTISAAEKGFKGFMGSADIHVSADGKFLYCSNRGDANTITIFKINAANGKLTVAGYQSTQGKGPRNFSLDPSGNFLLVANQNSDNIVIFKRNKITGLLTDTGKKIEVGNPVCLKWMGVK
ncbi:MAG: lactonase family protein [Chitinophagaceae bacterium]